MLIWTVKANKAYVETRDDCATVANAAPSGLHRCKLVSAVATHRVVQRTAVFVRVISLPIVIILSEQTAPTRHTGVLSLCLLRYSKVLCVDFETTSSSFM